MEKYKLHPETARNHYLSVLETIEILQDSIDVEIAANAARERYALSGGVTFINEDTGEETHYDLKPDPEWIEGSKARIAKDEGQIKNLQAFIAELLEDHPELANI